MSAGQVCCVCGAGLPEARGLGDIVCSGCRVVHHIIFTSVDDAIRSVLPRVDSIEDLTRALDLERARPNPRATLVLALERRRRALVRGAGGAR